MINKVSLETFRYFIECYFHTDIDYSDFEKIVFEFKNTEYEEYSVNLLKDAKAILSGNDWEYIREFVYKYSSRNYEKDRLIEMIWSIIRVLS